MKIAKALMLVRINKAAQTKKRSMVGSIHLHHEYVFMERNLQFGEIIQIGELAAKNYPMAAVGDEVAFHHTIEDDQYRVLDVADNGDELLYVYAGDQNDCYEIYGFFTQGGELIPSRHYVWLAPNVTRLKRKPISDTLILDTPMGDDWDTPEQIQKRIDWIKEQREMLQPSISATRYPEDLQKEYDRRVEVINQMNKLQEEGGKLTALLSKKKLGIGTTVAINSEIGREYPQLAPGSSVIVNLPLYPLEIYNEQDPENSAQFHIVLSSEILAYTGN